jgi:hypothetical protein
MPARIDIVLRAAMLARYQRDVTGFMQFDFYIAD